MGTSIVGYTNNKETPVLPASFPSGKSFTTPAGITASSPGGTDTGAISRRGTNPANSQGGYCTPLSLPVAHALLDADLTRTAHTSAILLNPLSAFLAASASTHGKVNVIPLNEYTRVSVKARLSTSCTAIGSGTMPVLDLWVVRAAAWDSANERFIGVEDIERIDNDDITASGITLTFPNSSPSTSNTVTLADGWYTTGPEADRTGYDCRGFPFLFALRRTAIGSLTGTGASAHAIARLTN